MPLLRTEQGQGRVLQDTVRHDTTSWQLSIPANARTDTPTEPLTYHNAQLSDYDASTRQFSARPPLRLRVRARMSASETLRGTAGFGWWNHPFSPTMAVRDVRLPQAVWFFFSGRDSHMPLALGQPAQGWKGATFNAQTALFYALLPVALPGFLAMRVPYLHGHLWRIGQKALGIHEAHLPTTHLAGWHDYQIDWWGKAGADFYVDGVCLLRAPDAPAQALGFVAWMDNQFAIVTPQGRFGFGIVPEHEAQSLWLDALDISVLR